MKNCISLLFFILMTGCFQVSSDDEGEDLRTVPVTNNPLIVPQSGGGMPMNFDGHKN